ncbi:polysaccharide pyruvyl transferase family protein [Natrinema pallidum]|uniref:Polysaccharide pyruvyl transferase family protein n=1 Tax=Natrinema pallidum TaxID=69527 RepID=A0A4V1IFI1_9EURY|nr:polysaccharide pyruvyl transferase family protein [Natrinema pallidum]QCW05074.1 polysaccharide pyruvyl transferase family protein [Natrinema pallidum]
MQILLLQTWIANIGNGFIDKGARVAIERAFPDAEIIEASGHPNLVGGRKTKGFLPNVFSSRDESAYGELYRHSSQTPLQNIINVGELVDVDVAVLPGCILYEHVLEKYYPVFEKLAEDDTPLVLLGAGGGDYDPETQRYVKQFINEVEPAGIITRDRDAYESYSDDVPRAHDGIDCAFFINEWYDPPTATDEYDVATFDKQTTPKIASDRRTIHTDHYPFEQPYGNLWQKIKKMKSQWKLFNKENVFVSDSLRDYLFLYANTRVTHSDRIHACVPTLAYGNRAQFWFDTPRGTLFEKVLDEDIQDKPVSVDQSLLKRAKQEQVEALQSIISHSL